MLGGGVDGAIHRAAAWTPAISCGIYGYPIDEAATIAVREVRAFLEEGAEPQRVLLVAHEPEMHQVLTTKITKDRR